MAVDLDLKTVEQVVACGYEPIQRKGHGAYGFVYEVGDTQGDLFAFKYIVPDKSYRVRGLESLNEIDILTRVEHPHVIHAAKIITSHNCHIDGTAIVLPLADRTLYDIIRDPLMTTDDKLPILYKLSAALQFLHESHILHLDIKSTNVVLQGTTPYFIDFGLCMVVDDAIYGKYDRSLRVTIDHRPPEILAGGRIYNAAVDVWSFGIMMLYVLSGRGIFNVNFNKISEYGFYEKVVEMFSNKNTIENLLSGVRPKYRDLCIDLISNILQIDPSNRLTSKQICDHPLFNEFRHNINGKLLVPSIPYDYANDQRDIVKLMIFWATNLYKHGRAEILFLAVDLFNRTSSYYKDKDPLYRMTLAATCLWLAAKLTDGPEIALSSYVSELAKQIKITDDMILQEEIFIIHILSGVLNVSSIYSCCDNGNELRFSFDEIIMSRDSTLYARVDIEKWPAVMKQYITNITFPNKNITIGELLS